jgi:hypothetical protein
MAMKMMKKNNKKSAAKPMPKPAKISPASKPRSRGEVYRVIAEQTGCGRKDVVGVFEVMSRIIEADLSRSGPGVFQVPGLMKVVRINKPAQPARKGVPNPFKPGELMDVAAKPARNIVKVRALKSLKSMV